MENEGVRDSIVDFQAILGDKRQTTASVAFNDTSPLSTPSNPFLLSQPLVFHGQLSDQEYGSFAQESVGVTFTLPEGADPLVGQLSQGKFAIIAAFPLNAYHVRLDLFLSGTFGSVSYELGTQPFQNFVPGTYSEEHIFSGPSAKRRHQLCIPVLQDGQEKVKCMRSGCSSVVNKDNLTRHVNETHRRQVKAVCTSCGKEFQRSYMKKNHICRVRHSKRRSF